MKKVALIILIPVLGIALSTCSANNYSWGWYELSPFRDSGLSNLLFLVEGAGVTLGISFLAFILSVLIGFVIAFLRKASTPAVRFICYLWTLIFRSVPVLVMLLWLYYGLSIAFNINLNVATATVLGLALCQSAFQAEVFRTGIESIPKSQIEAAQVFGANVFQVYYYIIIPQVLRQILPTLANQFVYMLKISSLASVIGLRELTRKANELTVTMYRPLEIYTVLVLEYLVLIFIFAHIARVIEKKYSNTSGE